MSEILKRNFEPGRLLLVATLLLSLTLISQLYVISESIDVSNGFQFSGVELSLAASYVFSALSMVIVINEFFQVKTKMKGLLALNQLINRKPIVVEQETISNAIVPDELMLTQEESELTEVSGEIDEDQAFDNLLETEFTESKPVKSEALSKYKTTKIKLEEETSKLEPIIEEGELQNLFDDIEEESEMDRLLAESEVIATLAELEELVQELRQKKAPEISQ